MTVLEIPTPDPRALDESSRPFALAVSSRFAIKKLIGSGGMGMVYLARDRRLDRLVAIKTLPPHLAADESVRQRFFRETRMAGALSHPNIVPIFGADEIDGHSFFTMGFVEGEALNTHVRAEGRLDPARVAHILRDVASALEHAHERGIIHRDIKAENILIERGSGRALVTDFGIARLAEATPLTATGQILGTVYYTSPEQVTGEPVDGRSDVYSLGVVGFYALTGRFPFDAELASAVLIAHVNKPAPAVQTMAPTVPDALAAVIDRCLAKNPAQRYPSARDARLALDAAMRTPVDVDNGKALLVSDAEAEAIWSRAAELQAKTGVHSRTVSIQGIRDANADQARASGMRVAAIRDAGREAGIRTQFLDRALAERGLVKAPHTLMEEPKSWWAGVPLEIVRETELPTEISPKHFDRLRSILQLATGDKGTTSAYKREFAWQTSSLGNSLNVSIVPADGKTTVRLTQNARRMAVSAMTSAAVAGAVVIGPIVSFVSLALIRMPTPPWLRDFNVFEIRRPMAEDLAVALGAAAAVLTLPLARFAIQWAHRRLRRRSDALLEAVVSNADTARD